MKRLCVFLAAAALSTPAAAQSIRVQSGDHQGFTRLVLTIGEDREWALSQADNETWQVTLDPAPEGFDFSRAFDLIQRTRLAELSGDGILQLNLACNCPVSGFRHNETYLVLDIADPDPNAVIREVEQEPEAAPQTDPRAEERAAAAAALPDLTRLLTEDRVAETPGLPVADTSPQTDPVEEAAAPATVAEGAQDPSPLPPPNPNLQEAAQIMAEQLARAAASGLLDVDIDQPFDAADPLRSEPDPEPEAIPEPEMSEVEVDESFPIHTENALDAILDLQRLSISAIEPGACRNAEFNARTWTEAGSLYSGLGPLRLALYDDRDVLVEDAALDLARHYLYFGFGAEAAYWLDQANDPPIELGYVADLVDGAPSAPFPTVESPSDCSDGELLWRYLGGSVSASLTDDDISSIQRAFFELPAGLRDQIGPRLARALHADGLAGSARNIRNAVARGGRLDPALLHVLDVDLGLVSDRALDLTREALAEAVRDDGADPVAIMAAALAFDRGQGQLPDPDRLVAADALLREFEGSGTTAPLWQEVLIGRAALGQIDRAINMLAEPGHSPEAWDRAMTTLVAERVAANDIAALLILAHRFGRNWRPEGSAAGRAQIQAIAVLREAGYFSAADILRDVRRPLILPASETPSDDPDPVQDAWANRDWEALANVGSGPHGDVASRLASLPEDPEAPNGLDELSERLADSRDLRSVISDLLSDPGLRP